MDRENQYSLLLLAGGKSARMGTSKAELLYEGKSFLAHMLDKAKKLGITRFFISGYSSPNEDVTTVWDQYPDRGPLGGIHAGLKAWGAYPDVTHWHGTAEKDTKQVRSALLPLS